MTILEILEIIRVITLIVVIVFSITLAAYALIKAFREKGFPRRRLALCILALGTLFITYLAYNVREIAPADWAQILLMLGLVAVTGSYAFSAAKQAEEMKEQRLAMYKPHIILEKLDGTRGTYFMKEIEVGVWNDRGGAATNVEFYIFHPVFKFDAFRHPSPISVQDNPVRHNFHVEKPSVEDDPRVTIDPTALVVANYEDVSGNRWHSTLELIWDATTKDIRPGYTQVALSGHHNIGDSSA